MDAVLRIFTFSKLLTKRKSLINRLERNEKRQVIKFNNLHFLSKGTMQKDAFSDK